MPANLDPQTGPLLSHVFLLAGLLLWILLIIGGVRLRRRWPTLILELMVLSGLLLAQMLFFWRPLLSAVQIPNGGGDLASFSFPLQAFVAQQIQQGHFPLWNPYLHGGMPQFANFQAAMLYPPNLIAWFLIRPFRYQTLELLVIGHYLVASLGTYALARSLGQRRLPAVLTGVVFAYSGFLTAHLGHYTMLAAAVWLPLLLLTVRQLALSRSWLWAAAVGAVVFLATTAGHQQTLLYELTAAGIWWLFWWGEREGFWLDGVDRDWEFALRKVARPFAEGALRFGSALALGLMLAAPVILPSLQLSQLSVRTRLSYEQSTEFSVEPIALLHFILPKAFGSNPTDYWGPFASGEIWGYVGVVTLVLVALAFAVRPTRIRLLLGGIAGIAFLYALGPFTPLQGWAYRFAPLYDLVRAPARGFLYVDLCLALLAGFGLQDLLDGPLASPRLHGVLRSTLRVLVIILAALLLFVLPLYYSLIIGVNDPLNRPMIVVDGIYLLIFYLGGTAVLLWAALHGHLRGASVGLLLLCLVTLDLFGATASFNPTPGDLTSGFRHTEAVQFLQARLQREGPFRIDVATAAWQPDLAAIAGLEDIGGAYDPMQLKGYDQARSAVSNNRSLPLYNLLGARYLITDDKTPSPGAQFQPVLRTQDGLLIWENSEALPRVWLATHVQEVSIATARAAIVSPTFDPQGVLYLSGGSVQPVSGAGGTARITENDPNTVRIQVDANGPAELMLADVAYPGWVAQVDGKSTPIATADGLFRAVAVPTGSHEVVFHFQPPLLRVSLGISVVGFILGLFMLGFGFYRRRIEGEGFNISDPTDDGHDGHA
ncbi:MAG TPA: YfhO family protein [Nitrolancea sp.]|nr:YfhO family protein [Nitrolancea sp.]